ncbi:MAG: exopolyphosphatase [Bacteroidota bacterium]
MANAPVAVIDLGTNTFHLLIVRITDTDGQFQEVYRERRFVKLAEEGIQTIGQTPFERGLNTLQHYRQLMDEHGVRRYQATGTAALRTASNGKEFVSRAAELGIRIDLISGDEEAHLISQGVLLAIPPLQEDRALIMDIGGGSVEFIFVTTEGVEWARSFPVGVAVLYRQFHHSEPIANEEITAAKDFLRQKLAPLWDAVKTYPINYLVGAAGTFDVIADLMGKGSPTPNSHIIDLTAFDSFYNQCLEANQEERHQMKGVPSNRADMIVVALILVQVVLEEVQPDTLLVSDYSMKEGILRDILT